MALLRFSNQVPPMGGFRFRQPESRLVIEGESLTDLVERIRDHRIHKGLAPTDRESIRLEAERQICGRLGLAECKPEGIADEWTPVPAGSDVMSLEKISSFSRAAWEWGKSGGELVPLHEAERRRDICAGCAANTDPGHDCFTCKLGQLIAAAVPAERRFPELHVCGHCGCELRSKVSLPKKVIIASDIGRGIVYPNHCWQKEILDESASVS